MKRTIAAYQLFPLGDQALQIDFGNRMDPALNDQVVALYQSLLRDPLPGITEMVPAYSSLAIFYELSMFRVLPDGRTAFDMLQEALRTRLQSPLPLSAGSGRSFRIPVCYDTALAPGLETAAVWLQMDIPEIIKLHCTPMYRVYMNGFLPGFPYMGEVDPGIVLPRKPQPEPVKAGSVGIAGKQTGIYPMDAPGGWHIIGRTPLQVFDPDREEAVGLQAGDTVQFYPVSREAFDNWQQPQA